MSDDTTADWLTQLVLEHAASAPAERPLSPALNLRGDLGLDSMSLVALMVRLGDDLGLDVGALDVELGSLKTFGDLLRVARLLGREGL